MEEKYSKISPTAIFCARMRAKQDVLFAKEIIKLIDTKFSNLIEDLPDYGNTLNSKPNYIPFIEGRYYSLNESLSKVENAFIVEIASGLSPRSLEFSNKKDIIYVETELEGLINLKEKILKEIIKEENLDDKNLIFMSINPLKKEDMDKIGKLYKEKGKKQLILIHEGLLIYFDKNEKRIFRDNMKYLFEKYNKKGLWLTSDFSRIKKDNEIKGKENIRDKISKVTKIKFDYFKSEEETKEFLKEKGFRSEIISNENIIKKLIMKKALLSNKDEILESSKGYRVWKIDLF
jgi:O-methyltransferase involved in polyketide biosynthesis